MGDARKFRERFAELQFRFKSGKDQFNAFGGFAYRNVETMLDVFKPLGNELGIHITFEDEVRFIEGRFYVVSTAIAHDTLNELSAPISATGWAREAEHKTKTDDAQLTGMCSSYARKYALSALLAVGSEKDADSVEGTDEPQAPQSHSAPPEPPAKPPRGFLEFTALKNRLVAAGMDAKAAGNLLKKELGDPRSMDEEQYRSAIANGDVLVRSYESNVNQ